MRNNPAVQKPDQYAYEQPFGQPALLVGDGPQRFAGNNKTEYLQSRHRMKKRG